MVKAGIFDIGGVLALPSSFRELHDRIVKEFVIEQAVFDAAWKELYPLFGKGKLHEGEFWTQLQQKTGFTRALPAEGYLYQEYEKMHTRVEETYEIVRELRKSGIKTAILSNMIPPHTKFLREAGVVDDFDVVIISDEVGYRKPEPEIFTLVLDELAVKPDETFFVDDQQKNIIGAEKLGIHGILFTSADQLRIALQQLGVTLA